MAAVTRKAQATWEGSVARGTGGMSGGSGGFELPYSLASREGDTEDTNPEELVGAALAGCYAMSLANLLTKEGHPPERLRTTASVELSERDGRFSIPRIELETVAAVEGVDADRFEELSREAASCPIARLYAGAEIDLRASLDSG